MKLQVGKTYELNDGTIAKCESMRGDDPLAVDGSGYGPFLVDGCCYHQDGKFGARRHPSFDVRRCVDGEGKPDMDKEYKTLRELDVRPGDVVECMTCTTDVWTVGKTYGVVESTNEKYPFEVECNYPQSQRSSVSTFRIVSRASRNDTPKLWRDMTPEEKGALLLARHEDRHIESYDADNNNWYHVAWPAWEGNRAYRIRAAHAALAKARGEG